MILEKDKTHQQFRLSKCQPAEFWEVLQVGWPFLWRCLFLDSSWGWTFKLLTNHKNSRKRYNISFSTVVVEPEVAHQSRHFQVLQAGLVGQEGYNLDKPGRKSLANMFQFFDPALACCRQCCRGGCDSRARRQNQQLRLRIICSLGLINRITHSDFRS